MAPWPAERHRERVHYVWDVTLGEGAGQAWTGATPQALAAFRNGILALLRTLGWSSITDALGHYGAHAHQALHLPLPACL